MNRDTILARMTGIADEGAPGLEEQLELHRRLGWSSVELRNVDGVNVCEMDDETFEILRRIIAESGMAVAGLGSAIANWARPITGPFERDLEDLRRAAPRARALGTRYIRIMSYPNDGLPEAEWAAEALRRLGELTRIAAGEGVVLVHENCDGWASSTPERLARLLDEIPDPALQIVFDTGNPVSHGGDADSVRRFFAAALPRIVHFHIKDCVPGSGDGHDAVHVMPGEGSCAVEEIVGKLLASGYGGLFSIEPHMAVQIHLGSSAAPGVDQRGIYMEYGRKATELVARAAEGRAGWRP